MHPIWKSSDIRLCNLADGVDRQPKLIDRWRVNRRRARRHVRDHSRLNEPRFFCQNSGACGSTYLVQLLRDNRIERCFHEKSPDLNAIGVRHFDQPYSRTYLRSVLRYTRWDVFFEANNRLFSLSRELADAFPGARFIHLFRDGRHAVASAMSKPNLDEYLGSNIRFQGTLAGPHRAPALRRFCHYWNKINRRILDDLDAIAQQGPVYYLSLADLKNGDVDGLADFMNIQLATRVRPVVNQGRLGAQGQFPTFEDWTGRDQQTFWDICGATLEELQTRRKECRDVKFSSKNNRHAA